MIKRFLLVWLINALGLFAASWLFAGVDYSDKLTVLLIGSLIFGVINALVRPLVVILSLPAMLLTLGLFTFVVNGFMLWLTSRLYPAFTVKSMSSAIAAVLIVWLVNYLFDIFILKEESI